MASPIVQPQPCPVCEGTEWNYLLQAHGQKYFACGDCGLTRLQGSTIPDRVAGAVPTPAASLTEDLRERAEGYWCHLLAWLGEGSRDRRVLLVGSEALAMLAEVGRELGFHRLETCPATNLDAADDLATAGPFDILVVVFALERARDLASSLQRLHDALRPGGHLLLVLPTMDSWPARVCGALWTELRPENRFLLSRATVQSALLRTGFHRLWLRGESHRYRLTHLEHRARTYPSTRLTRLVRGVCGLLPDALKRRARVPLATSTLLVTATRDGEPTGAPHAPRRLSIVMPVFDERATFEDCYRAVRDKVLPEGLEKEIIVVESNSRDGTRELVQRLCGGDPIVRLILQEHAAGKGNAVRAGLAAASGDLVLIQDADLEYDVSDYDVLLRPLLAYRAAFVLGSRHTGTWKMRHFNDQALVASFFNVGHLLFCAGVNVLYGQRLKDPFTMYKVFRADCLHGLRFECNRFDFDFEILIKLLRKGYQPIEIPVNYNARSLTEGKKVTAVRDPLTWLRALVKYRFEEVVPPVVPELRPVVATPDATGRTAGPVPAGLQPASARGKDDGVSPVTKPPVQA